MMNEQRYMMVVARSAAPVASNNGREGLHRALDERDRLRAQNESLRLQLKAVAADNARLASELYTLRRGGAQHG